MVPACSTASAVLSRPGARHRGRITVAPRKTTAAKSAFPVGTHAKLRRRRVAAVEGDGATTANTECDDDEEIPDVELVEPKAKAIVLLELSETEGHEEEEGARVQDVVIDFDKLERTLFAPPEEKKLPIGGAGRADASTARWRRSL